MAALMSGVLGLCWHALVWIIDLIDGGEDDTDDPFADTVDNLIHYNHRSAEIDSVKRLDGLYDNPQ